MKSWLVSVMAVGYMIGGTISVEAVSEIVAAWLIKDDGGKQEELRYSPENAKYLVKNGDHGSYSYSFQEKDSGQLEIAQTASSLGFSTMFSASPLACTTTLGSPASLIKKIFIENKESNQQTLAHTIFQEIVYKLDQPIEPYSRIRIKKKKTDDLLIQRTGQDCSIVYGDNRWTCDVISSAIHDTGRRRLTPSHTVECEVSQKYHYKVEGKQGEAYKGTFNHSAYQPCGTFDFQEDLPVDKTLFFQESTQLSENTYQDILVLGDEKYVVTWNPDKDMDTLEVCKDNSLPKRWITPRRVVVGSGCALLAGALYKLNKKEDFGNGVVFGGFQANFNSYFVYPVLNYVAALLKNK